MPCKKNLMGLAALFILFFHLWIKLTNFTAEDYIIKSLYIGVDLFFLLSGFSVSSKKYKYKSFLKNRMIYIYIPFLFFSFIASLYKGWSFHKFMKIIIGLEFITKGGGSFLWFFPALMIFYIISPLFIYIKNKYDLKGIIYLFIIWIVIGIFFKYVFELSTVYILINRLPIIIIGLYYNELKNLISSKYLLVISLFLVISGSILIISFGSIHKVNIIFPDSYYIFAIPFVLGTSLMAELIYTNNQNSFSILQHLGKITLELYSIQMILGFNIENAILYKTLSLNISNTLAKLLTMISTYLIIILFALIANKIYHYIINIFYRRSK